MLTSEIQARRPALVGCVRLLTLYTAATFVRVPGGSILHPQTPDALCRCDIGPHNMVRTNVTNYFPMLNSLQLLNKVYERKPVHNLQFSFSCHFLYLIGLSTIYLYIHANSVPQCFTYFYFLFKKPLCGLEDVMPNVKIVIKL